MEKPEPKPIVFTDINVDGAPKVFVNAPWPQFTSVDYDAVAANNTGLVLIDGDSLKFTAANGTAEYLKMEVDGQALYELVESTFDPMPEEDKAGPVVVQQIGENQETGEAESDSDLRIRVLHEALDAHAPDETLSKIEAVIGSELDEWAQKYGIKRGVPKPAEEPVSIIDTHAEDEPLQAFEPRKTFGQVVAAEVRAAHLRNDAAGHAALHNFDIALGDFKRAAQQVLPTFPKESELAQIIESIVADL